MLNARLEDFMHYEITLIEQVLDHVASATPTHYILVSEEEPKARPLILSVDIFEEKRERTSFSGFERSKWPWVPSCSGESKRAGLAIFKLRALTCNASIDTAFPHAICSRDRYFCGEAIGKFGVGRFKMLCRSKKCRSLIGLKY